MDFGVYNLVTFGMPRTYGTVETMDLDCTWNGIVYPFKTEVVILNSQLTESNRLVLEGFRVVYQYLPLCCC